ncbi:MAG: hypothetical protein WBS33_10110 [Verrucomicrobiia bacterium]
MSTTEKDAFKKKLDATFPPNQAIMTKAVAARSPELRQQARNRMLHISTEF